MRRVVAITIIAKNYMPRRFLPPWTVEETDACFVVRDAKGTGETSARAPS
jgi:hypothetical protein